MFENIEVYAGEKAKKHLLERGLKGEDIKVMAGAAGGPKFLVLNGIDKYLFGELFKGRKTPLYFIGSSIGAFRASALGQKNPVDGLEKLTTTYHLDQKYSEKPSPADITRESERIIDHFLSEEDIDYLLNKSFLRVNFFSSKFSGLGASDNKVLLGASLIGAMAMNRISRSLLYRIYENTIFTAPGNRPPFYHSVRVKEKNRFELTQDNFKKALSSSGAIPWAMLGIKNIPGTGKGTFRDGGICEYHMDIDFNEKEGLVLFPHFSSTVTPGWLDKGIKSRKAHIENFSNTIMVCPSKKFTDSLPGGHIPTREDFIEFLGKDNERIKRWAVTIKKSKILGQELQEAIDSNRLKDIAKDFNF